MALAPKPISLTQVATNTYAGAGDPQPFVVVGDIPGGSGGAAFDPTELAGYDDGETQTLKNVNGVLTWVTDEA